jgi:cell division inhibitor SepF
MAAGIMKKAMVYLGLADDEFDDYEYDEPSGPSRRYADPEPAVSSVRPVARDYGGWDTDPRDAGYREPGHREPGETAVASVSVTPRAAVVRPITTVHTAKPHVVEPTRFADAQLIGDRFRGGQPVVVNLQDCERDLARRMIDFCSGVTYALNGAMEKIDDNVFLLAPSGVEVSSEERRRLQERGYRS